MAALSSSFSAQSGERYKLHKLLATLMCVAHLVVSKKSKN